MKTLRTIIKEEIAISLREKYEEKLYDANNTISRIAGILNNPSLTSEDKLNHIQNLVNLWGS